MEIPDLQSVTNATRIIVRVMTKSGLRHRVEEQNGKLVITNTYFTMHLLSQFGEIHTMAFKNSVFQMIDLFKEGKLYEIRKVKISKVSKQYWHPKFPNHVILTRFTKVKELEMGIGVYPIPAYRFTKISDTETMNHGAILGKTFFINF